MALLPHADQAVVNRAKLRDYSLNPAHPAGMHKARVFVAALGVTVNEVDDLREAILSAALREPATLGRLDQYGQRYVVDFLMHHGERQAVVRSTWIIRAGEDIPRLTSCHVL